MIASRSTALVVIKLSLPCTTFHRLPPQPHSASHSLSQPAPSSNVPRSADFPAGFGNWWDGQLTEEAGYYNVVLELHNYDCYGESSSHSVAQHLAQAQMWEAQIRRLQQWHPVLIGEFTPPSGPSDCH